MQENIAVIWPRPNNCWLALLLKEIKELLLLIRAKVFFTQILDTNTEHATVYRDSNLAKVESLVLTLTLNMIVLPKVLNVACSQLQATHYAMGGNGCEGVFRAPPIIQQCSLPLHEVYSCWSSLSMA